MKQLNKYFIFSDIHGEYDSLIESLKEAGYESSNPNHFLVSIGDAFDRGPKSRQMYDFLRREKSICVKGNHDFFLEEYLNKGMDGEFVLFNILHNGLGATIASFMGINKLETFKVSDLESFRKQILSTNKSMPAWLGNLPLYFETKHFIFVHAGINPNLSNWKNTDADYMTWDIEDSHRPCNNIDKVVVIGHHHAFRVAENASKEGYNFTSGKDFDYRINDDEGNHIKLNGKCYGNKDKNGIYVCGNKIAIDGCINLTHKANVLVIEDYPITTSDLEETTNNENNDPEGLKTEFNINFSNTTGYVRGNYETIFNTYMGR